jgi:drug/metabolite transporter (DMT)-like permease
MKEQLFPTLWLIGLSLVTSILGQTTIKLGVSRPESAGLAGAGPISVVLLVVRSPLVLLGLLIYGVGALAWIVVLSRVDMSYAYPFLALNFVLITVVSRVVFSETIPGLRWLGIVFICIGILLVARSSSVGQQ